MTRVILVDYHPVFRNGLRALLQASGIDVVGEAATGADAVHLAAQLTPDVVLMDLGLPDMSGRRGRRPDRRSSTGDPRPGDFAVPG